MTIETSTINVLMLAVLSLQCWMVRELFKLKAKVSIMISHCTHCKQSDIDTDQFKKTV